MDTTFIEAPLDIALESADFLCPSSKGFLQHFGQSFIKPPFPSFIHPTSFMHRPTQQGGWTEYLV